MSDAGRAYARFVSAAARVGAAAGNAAMGRSQLRLPRAARRSGVLCEGDPATPPGVDVLDYRGLASLRDLTALIDGEPPLGRFLDCRGRHGPPLGLRTDLLFRHAMVVGPSGSGKTVSVIAPWIVSLLRQGASVVTIDVRGDLLTRVQTEAARTGGSTGSRLWLWDYSGAPSHRWNWLAEASDARTVEACVTSIIGKLQPGDPQPHFYHRDYRWLRALIMLVQRVHGHSARPEQLLNALNDQTSLVQLVRLAGPSQEASALADLTTMHPDDYSRALAGLLNALSVFSLPNVAAVTETSDFQLSQLCDRPTLLVAVAPLADARLGETLSGILVSQAILRMFARFQTTGTSRPLFLVIDEAPRLRNKIDFEELLSVARGASAGVVLAAQDVAQFGDERLTSAIFANCHTFLVMPGVSSETASYFSKRLGERPVATRSVTQAPSTSPFGSVTIGSTTANAPVLGQREIMHPPFGPYVAFTHVPSVARGPFLVDLEQR